DAAYGLGYPFFSYYAALPYYLTGLLALVGFDLLTALKAVQTAGFVAAALAACAGAPEGGATGEVPDVIHTVDKEAIRCRIVAETASQVTYEGAGGRTSVLSRGFVRKIDYGPETWKRLTERPLRPAEGAGESREAAGSWFARRSASEGVEVREITWQERSDFKDVIGEKWAEACRRTPELHLFLPAGGAMVLGDPRGWGYHARTWPDGALHLPEGKAGLRVPLPAEEGRLPEAVAFVSPSMEMKTREEAARMSYAPSDVIYAAAHPAAHQEGMLAAQPFSGGAPRKTPLGELWAFGLPRNAESWWLYAADGEARAHRKVLDTLGVAFGDTLLVPEVVIDVKAADGAVAARMLLLPYPDEVGLDAAASVTLFVGTPKDPSPLARVALPPRQAVIAPLRPPATRADVWVQHYDVSPRIPQRLLIAYGTGRPTAGATVVEREIAPESADERVRLDLSGRAEEEFPAVVWFSARRTFVWRTPGGRLERGPEAPQEGAVEALRLARTKRSGPLSHVVPIYFRGPAPVGAAGVARGGGADPAAAAVGGMSSALLQDALRREAGGPVVFPAQPISGPAAAPAGGASNGLSNTTYVQVVVPPHTFGGGGLGGMAGAFGGGGVVPPPAGMYLTGPGAAGATSLAGLTSSAMPVAGYMDGSGNYYSPSGQPLWNNQAATYQYYSGAGTPGAQIGGFDPIQERPIIRFTRSSRP
ncbi:MAG: hypothetical protein ACK44W_02380, partial [Planctomycetota bacterium]